MAKKKEADEFFKVPGSDSLFEKLNTIPGANRTPQKTVAVTASKRENQTQAVFWCDNKIVKKLKLIALDEGTNQTELLTEGALAVIRKRYPDFEID